MYSPSNSEYEYNRDDAESWYGDISTDSEPMDISPPSSPRQPDTQNEEVIQTSDNEVSFFTDILMDNSICFQISNYQSLKN